MNALYMPRSSEYFEKFGKKTQYLMNTLYMDAFTCTHMSLSDTTFTFLSHNMSHINTRGPFASLIKQTITVSVSLRQCISITKP